MVTKCYSCSHYGHMVYPLAGGEKWDWVCNLWKHPNGPEGSCEWHSRNADAQSAPVTQSDPREVREDPERRRQWGIIDHDEDYILMRDMDRRFLLARDPHPAREWHVLRVPADMLTVEEAHAWTFGLAEDEYRVERES